MPWLIGYRLSRLYNNNSKIVFRRIIVSTTRFIHAVDYPVRAENMHQRATPMQELVVVEGRVLFFTIYHSVGSVIR